MRTGDAFVAEYITDLIKELRNVALKGGLEHTAYLLDLALEEARRVAQVSLQEAPQSESVQSTAA